MELQIQNLSKTYPNGVHALNGISLTIPRGMFGLLGPNGAGTFLTGFGEGDVYSEDEVEGWLEETGWMSLGSRPLAGGASLLVAMPV